MVAITMVITAAISSDTQLVIIATLTHKLLIPGRCLRQLVVFTGQGEFKDEDMESVFYVLILEMIGITISMVGISYLLKKNKLVGFLFLFFGIFLIASPFVFVGLLVLGIIK